MEYFDSFLSYAGEDTQLATEIAGALKSRGFRIWYAPFDLAVGDKLLDSIEKGMMKSRSGILLISPSYLDKGWTNFEMDTLIRQNIESDKKIFPIWHDVEKSDVEKRHTGLGGIVSLKTDVGLSNLVVQLTQALASFAPTIGVIPSYESPAFRFLQGRGEITLGHNGPATTLWELLIHANVEEYPIYLDGRLYSKDDLLFAAAQLLPHIPEEVRKWVKEDGRQKIWNMCVESGHNPSYYE